MKTYDDLKTEMPEIVKLVEKVPVAMQEKALEILCAAYLNNGAPKVSAFVSQAVLPPSAITPSSNTKSELSSVAYKTPTGDFHFAARELKANNSGDAARRLIYVVMRSYMLVMNVQSVSRKKVINGLLDGWRLNNAQARTILANDKGIIKAGDEYSLDIHAERDADQFIQDILDVNLVGTWKPTSGIVKKKEATVEKTENPEKDDVNPA